MKKALALLAALSLLLLFGCTLPAMPWEPKPPPKIEGGVVPQPPVQEPNKTVQNQTAANETYWENVTGIPPEEPNPYANLTPRNISDKIGDGQFRIPNPIADPLKIYVLSAGYADAILVSKGAFFMLVDEGNPDILPYIKKLGVKRLNVLVATRDYSGAIAGMPDLLDSFPVDEFWENGVPASSPEYADLLARVNDNGITVKHPEAGDTLSLGGMEILVLNPQKQRLHSNPDTDAIVLRISAGDFCMLFLNPTVQERENALISTGESLQCDVITYFKHGEGRPEPSVLLARSPPKDVIISVGPNSDDLPSPTTLTRLTGLGASGMRVWRTDVNGTVRILYEPFKQYEIGSQRDLNNLTFGNANAG